MAVINTFESYLCEIYVHTYISCINNIKYKIRKKQEFLVPNCRKFPNFEYI